MPEAVVVKPRNSRAHEQDEKQKLCEILHQLTLEKVRPSCSTIKRRKRRLLADSKRGSAAKIDISAARARRIKCASRLRLPLLSTGKPHCAVPSKSPGPRKSQSA